MGNNKEFVFLILESKKIANATDNEFNFGMNVSFPNEPFALLK
jgi:hypothetical protein